MHSSSTSFLWILSALVVATTHGWMSPVQRRSVGCRASTTSEQETTTPQLYEGVRDLVNEFDVFLLDMWGVMHDGSRPYDGVLDVVQKLKGKTLIILSNSSKRRDHSERMLRKLGFDPNDFAQIITSGELAYQMLSGESSSVSWPLLDAIEDKRAFVYGSGSEDAEYLESCGWTLAPVEEASLLVARGTFTIDNGRDVIRKGDDPEAYDRAMHETLTVAAQRRLPMLVCNPDKVRPDVDRPPMPGKIGDDYQVIVGDDESLVKRIGKPFADVYDLALQTLGVDRSRVCMVGDALETDVTGASAAGVQSVWVLKDGIHGPDLDESNLLASALQVVEEFNGRSDTYAKGRKLRPDLVLPHFRW